MTELFGTRLSKEISWMEQALIIIKPVDDGKEMEWL